jgi:phosphate-selective porin OprO/OprP
MKALPFLLLVQAATAAADQPATTPNNRQATESPPTAPSSIDESGAGRVDQTEPPPFGRHPAPTPAIDIELINKLVDERIAARGDTAGWDPQGGFYIQNREHTSRLKLGGFTQFDGRFFVPRDSDPKIDQFAFTSIRPDLQGTVADHFDFRLFPDFAGGKLVVQDAYLDVRYGDAIKLRVGKFKVPFGLERLQAETDTTFISRGLPTQIAPNRDLGAEVFGELGGGVLAYQLGVFNGVPDGQSGDGDVSTGKEGAARIFVKPFVTGGSFAKDLGVGGAVTYGDSTGTAAAPDLPVYKTAGLTTFFQYRTGTTLMDTPIADGRRWRASAQGDYFNGPFGLLAEYVHSAEHVALASSHAIVEADAWQALAQWVITGDDATFKSVTPHFAFDPSKGHYGAFDVVARVGELRLDNSAAFDTAIADPTKSALRVWSAGGGLDWFPNRTFRFVLDYDRTWFRLGAKTGDRPTESTIIGRVQTAF